MSEAARLPPELILQIVDSVVPSGNSRIAIPPWDIATRTLLALTLVSRTTYAAATRNLLRHCLFIDSSRRLRLLLTRLSHPSSLPQTLPKVGLRQHIESLYLAPFRDTIDDLPTAIWIRELLCIVRGTLRRLVIDIPLRSVSPREDHLSVRPILRKSLEQLTQVEECVSIQDELYLDLHDSAEGVDEPPIWQSWLRLRKLGLYNVHSVQQFWHDIATMSNLDVLVLTQADSLDGLNFKAEYFSRTSRRLNVFLANASFEQPELSHRQHWASSDKDEKMSVTLYDIPLSYYGDENTADACRNWVKDEAIRGAMWDWHGCPVSALK
jgi:hypothetical protein